MELLFSGRMKPATVLSLSPLGPSAGKGGLKCANCTHTRERGFRFSGLAEHCSSSTFCPQTCLSFFISVVFQARWLRALSSQMSWVGGEDRKGQEKAVNWSQWLKEPRKQTARKNTWLLGLISLRSKVENKNMWDDYDMKEKQAHVW